MARLERLLDRYRQRNDLAAFAQIFDTTAPELLRIAVHLTDDPARAEDLVQDTFLTLIERAEQFDTRRALVPWLAGVLRNHARNEARRERRRRTAPLSDGPGRAVRLDEALDGLAWSETVESVVAGLPAIYRGPLVLRLQHGLAPAEIAVALGKSPGTVRSLLHRGLDALRAQLPDEARSPALAALPLLGGMGTVRPVVLLEAQLALPVTATVGLGLPSALSGVLMMSKVVPWLVGLTVALLLLGVVLAIGALDDAARERSASELALEGGEGAGGEAAGRPGLAGDVVPPPPETTPAVPEARGAASVRGTVRRGRTPAVAEIEIRNLGDTLSSMQSLLHPIYAKGPPIASTESAADGTFQFEDLPVGGYEVRARAADGGIAWARALSWPMRPNAIVHLNLWGGADVLEARARFADGRPFRGIVTASAGSGGLATWLPDVETDVEGRFRFGGLVPGPLSLSFIVEGESRSTFADVTVPLETERVFVVDGGLTTFRGTVVADDTDAPIQGAEITYDGRDEATGRGYVATAETDAAGTFELRMPAPAAHLWVMKPGFETLQASTKEGEPLRFRLKRRGHVTGRVVRRTDGAPVAHVPVHGWNWYTFGLATPLDVSADDGSYAAAVGPGKGMLYVLGGGWVSEGLPLMQDRSVNPLTLEVGQGAEVAHDLAVVRAGTIEGVVRDAEGVPLAGTPVLAELPQGWQGFQHRFVVDADRATVTDAEGRFRLENLVPGFPYEIAARPAVGLPGRSEPTPVASGQTRQIAIRLPEARRLLVQVVEQGVGVPIEGATVSASQAGGHEVSATTSADGFAELGPLLPAALELAAYHPAFLRQRSSGVFGHRGEKLPDPGHAPEIYVVTLQRGAFVAGLVLGVDGEPYVTGNVGVFPVGQKVGKGFGLAGLAQLGRTGRFRLGPVPPGTYDAVLVEKTMGFDRRQISRWTITAGEEELVLRVDPSQTETDEDVTFVHVTGPGGKPARALIRVHGRRRVFDHAEWLQEGRHEMRDIPKGTTVWVEIRDPKDADGHPLSGLIHGPVQIEPGTIEIELAPAPTLQGVVLGPDGGPLVGLLVTQLPRLPGDVTAPPFSFAAPAVRTDAKGGFELPGSRQPLQLLVDMPAGIGLRSPIPVDPGQTEIEIRLDRGSALGVTVTDAEGAPLEGAEVTVSLDDSPTSRKAKTGADGRALVEGLVPGAPYTLALKPPPGRTDLCSDRQEDWSAAETTVAMSSGRQIEGHAVYGTGPAQYAIVFWKDARGQWFETRTDVQGAFAVTAAAGPVVFVAAPNGSTRPAAGGPEVRIEVDTTTVRVPLK